MLQISSTRSRCKHPQAWRRGGTLLIWVRARHPPLGHVSVPFNVSALITKHAYVHIQVHRCTYVCASRNIRKPKNVGSLAVLHAHKDCVATLCLSVSKFSPFMCSQPPTRLFCLPLFPCGPPLSLSPSLLCCFLCLSHTPFSLFNSLFQSKYYLTSSQRLSTSQQLFFHCSPALIPLPAVFSLLQRGEPLSCIFQRKDSTSFICM